MKWLMRVTTSISQEVEVETEAPVEGDDVFQPRDRAEELALLQAPVVGPTNGKIRRSVEVVFNTALPHADWCGQIDGKAQSRNVPYPVLVFRVGGWGRVFTARAIDEAKALLYELGIFVEAWNDVGGTPTFSSRLNVDSLTRSQVTTLEAFAETLETIPEREWRAVVGPKP